MSNRTKNEICMGLWQFYKLNKLEGLDVDMLKAQFKHELFLGYRTENKSVFEGAADNRITIQAMESMVLATKKFLITKYRLNFRDERTPDQLLRSMVGSMILETGISEDGKTVWAKKTDGENEFTITAENPICEFKPGMVVWIAEPFVMQADDKSGKPWCELTKAEREDAAQKATIRSGSSMPKYLQKRRAEIKSITVNSDDVNAWLQLHLVEAEPFEREAFEDETILQELGLTAQEAREEGAETEIDIQEIQVVTTDAEKGVDTSAIGDEHFEALLEAEAPPPNDNEPPETTQDAADAAEELF